MRLPYAILAAALVALPLAHAQATNSTDPTVNQSDFDTSQPPADTSYLNDTNSSSASGNGTADPTVTDSDFDTSVPADDTSWLNADVSPADASTPAPAASGHAATPGFDAALLVGALALGAFVATRRR